MRVLGVGEQEEGQETPSHPSPNFPFLQFLLDTLKGSQGFPDSYLTWTGVAGGWDGRKRFSSPSSEERRWEVPTAPTRRVALCPRPPLSHPEEEARGSVQILAKVTAGRGMSALGSPSFQGANGLGSLSTLTNPTPWADIHLEFPAQLLFSGPHTSSHTHNEGPSCLLHTPLLCCQTFSHHTHTHSLVIHTENHPHQPFHTQPLVTHIHTLRCHTQTFPFHTPWVSHAHVPAPYHMGPHPSLSLLHTLLNFTQPLPRHTPTFPCCTHPL